MNSKILKYLLSIILLLFIFSCDKNNPTKPKDNNDPVMHDYMVATADIIIYEVNIRAFSNSGTFQGVIDRLDSIQALGINTIWLMPIHPIGVIKTVNSPYCVKNYTEVNPEFGTLDDFAALVSGAHEKGMSVIIDWVANHTAWDNPWISNKTWYTQDSNGDIIYPAGTNWQDVADLNYSNQDMRKEMIRSMKYWIENADIDGFRCDAADYVPYDFWKQAIDSLETLNRQLILLAEGTRSDHFSAGFQMNYSWNFYNSLKNVFCDDYSAGTLFTAHNSEYASIPEGKHKLRFTTNHDESAWDETPMTLFNGKNGALAASVITIYLGGVPLIYGSQEVGVTETISFFEKDPINWLLNPDMQKAYQEMLSLYNSSEAFRSGDLTTYSDANVAIFKRSGEQEEFLIYVNTRNQNISVNIPSALMNTSWRNAFNDSEIQLSQTISLGPYEYLVYTVNISVSD